MEKVRLLSEIKQLRNELDTSKTVNTLLERESPEAERQVKARKDNSKIFHVCDTL